MKTILIISTIFTYNLFAQNNYSTSSDWLTETKINEQKFEKIQRQFRGFDLAMVEVGYRFNTLYFAIKNKNYDLAHYNLDKIKKTIENGIQRRPKRQKNSKSMFLDTQYKAMKKALNSENVEKIQKEYLTTKQVCNSCHVAENVPFIHVVDPEYRWQPIK